MPSPVTLRIAHLVKLLILLLALTPACLGSDDKALAAEEHKCSRVYAQSDPCQFARDNCVEYTGAIAYVEEYYCGSSRGGWFMLDVILTGLLFVFIGTAAGDFFCPNLSTIAQSLGLSENLTGVTFLALGNGAPDLFASFRAIQSGSYGLAVGELLGGASFIVSCVVGAVAVVSGFRVTRRPFLRDIGFFLTAVVVLLVVLHDEVITTVESLILILLYVLYVVVVGVGKMIYQRQKKRRQERHRVNLNRPENSGENALIEQADTAFFQARDGGDGSESLIASPSSDDHGLGGRLGAHDRYNPWFFKHKTLASLHYHGYMSRSRLAGRGGGGGGGSSRVHFKSSPSIIPDSSPGGSAEFLMDDRSDISSSARRKSIDELPTSPLLPNNVTTSIVTVPLSSRASLDTPGDGESRDYPDHPRHILPTHALESRHQEWARIKRELSVTIPSFKGAAMDLWPFLEVWDDQSLGERVLSLFSVPSSFLLCITVPVVDMDDLDADIPVILDDDDNLPPRLCWKRWLFLLHAVTVPIFLALGMGWWSSPVFNAVNFFTWGFMAVVLAFIGLCMGLRYTSPYHLPKYHKLSCIVGFVCAMVWISAVAGEILVILESIGVIMHISQAIIGLTVLAIGNSLADLVADVTIAKMGYPNMAIAACFGGPMLNILLGVGVSTFYYNVTHTDSYSLKFTRTLSLSAAGLCVALVSSLIIIPLNSWKGTREYGFFLIGLYFVMMAVNIIIEVVGK
eukprot:Partr_v1_DN27275_c0_g1_i1_m38577 putative calcium exchanger